MYLIYWDLEENYRFNQLVLNPKILLINQNNQYYPKINDKIFTSVTCISCRQNFSSGVVLALSAIRKKNSLSMLRTPHILRPL